ncbi:MAG: multiheme c-type cytochrome [Nitrospinota bacterium]
MKKLVTMLLSLFLSFVFYTSCANAKRPKFVGTRGCKCHKPNIEEWKEGPHGKAYLKLKPEGRTEKIREKLRKSKLDEDKDYSNDKKCLPCHTTGFDEVGGFDPEDIDENFLGAGCESCHGPGGEYRGIHKEKDETFKRSETKAAGQLYPQFNPEVCEKCHLGKDAPQFVKDTKFDFDKKIREVKNWHSTNELLFSHEDGGVKKKGEEPLEKGLAEVDSGCLACHRGIEEFSDGAMKKAYRKLGKKNGDPAGCVVCHGGSPGEKTDKASAHSGAPEGLKEIGGPQNFYAYPGNLWINKYTCGQEYCHEKYSKRIEKALMTTEAGKIQGNFWSWGLLDNPELKLGNDREKPMKVSFGNYSITDDDGPIPSVGSYAYKRYMKKMVSDFPDQFPSQLQQVPDVNIDEVSSHPNLAGITYSRQECQRCHLGVRGREKRGDYRGQGCSACHVPYGNEGFYEGGDPSINKNERGHLLVHRRQGTRRSTVTVGSVTYSGIPNESCNTCHNRGKRIGVSYQGIMEFPYGSPYFADGTTQNSKPGGKDSNRLHTKKYLYIGEDLHHAKESRKGNPQGGLLCQDCHTTIDIHGDGNMFGTTLAQVEIECTDCHGTPGSFPWELPLGFGEEFARVLSGGKRGLDLEIPKYLADYITYPAEDGFLLTTRGNPFGNVVKRGREVILHSASGQDFKVPLLKEISLTDSWKNEAARVAMQSVSKHQESMECYACHSAWAPQCYGCHITVDYSENKMSVDWIKNSSAINRQTGETPDSPLGTNGLKGPGAVSETRSYLRWEEPILGINGEGRVTPLMPGCQVITTVIDKEGRTVAHNKIWETPEKKGLDHAAVQPHTSARKARPCESCHNNPKTLGYGIGGGGFMRGANVPFVVDLETALGETIPSRYKNQGSPVARLDHDLSQIVTRDDEQLVSIGSHWPLTGPLPKKMRDGIERTGLCLGCHKEMENRAFWDKVSTEGKLDNKEHQDHMHDLLTGGKNGKTKNPQKPKPPENKK